MSTEPNDFAVTAGAILFGVGLILIHPGLFLATVGAIILWFQFSKP